MQCWCGKAAFHTGPHREPPRVAYGYGPKKRFCRSAFVSTQNVD